MSQISDIALNDAGASARTFTAAFKDALECKWIYNDGSAVALRPHAIMRMRQEDRSKSVPRKTTVQVVVPYTETVNSVEVTKYATARLELTTPESASATVVGDLLAYSQGILAETLVSDTIKDAAFPL